MQMVDGRASRNKQVNNGLGLVGSTFPGTLMEGTVGPWS